MDGNFTNVTSWCGEEADDMSNRTLFEVTVYSLPFVRIGIPIIILLVSVVGLVGNILVIYVIIKLWRMNILFLNLATADLLFLIFCVPIQVLMYATKNEYVLPSWTCKLFYYLTYVTMGVSIYSLVCICVIRYIAVSKPLGSRSILHPKTNAAIVSGIIWMFTGIINIPLILYSGVRWGPCIINTEYNWQYAVYIVLVVGFDFFIPFAVVATLSMLIIWKVQKGQTKRMALSLRKASPHIQASSKRATQHVVVMVIVITAVFALCNLPNHILLLLLATDAVDISCAPQALKVFVVLLQVLGISNCSINPFLYNFASSEFRKEFVKALSLRRHKH
ncbi:somatostatin receptor type 5-like [Lingula anatina]|uniref:Somatostatin receptor type 5-like n=1 Tax=Lingula anatina TaxID=7574 RepID=A0A1S3HDG6_LINAN|nr:somatostatin receptor type 5-like [Lingula anatina]XP_013409039.1 somatostatin receptor type 5-like [Lingula anatina]|eukprot:XP_013383561.1 somatostatin receptor type 5-like [Lingula anatina]